MKSDNAISFPVTRLFSGIYTPYGYSTRSCTAGGPGFNGELHERGLGWQLLGNGYRAYSPVLMRFHSPDSLSPFGDGGLNAYAYCHGDPVNGTDPDGHAVKLQWLMGKTWFATSSQHTAFRPARIVAMTSDSLGSSVKVLSTTDVDAIVTVTRHKESMLSRAQTELKQWGRLSRKRPLTQMEETQRQMLSQLMVRQEQKVTAYKEYLGVWREGAERVYITPAARSYVQRKASNVKEVQAWTRQPVLASSKRDEIRKVKVD